MELSQPNETSFDLRFRLFRTPVRVHPFFWLTAVFLGWSYLGAGPEYLLMWVGVVFFSVLMHEMGHVWMGQAFGSYGSVVLWGMGGLAFGSRSVYGRWRRIAVSLAGPGIQLAFFVLLFVVLMVLDSRPKASPSGFYQEVLMPESLGESIGPMPDIVQRFQSYLGSLAFKPDRPVFISSLIQMLLAVNLWWAIINLMPVYPLDGGYVSRELFNWANPHTGTRNSLALSVAVALALAINSLSGAMHGPTIPYVPSGGVLFVFLFGFLAFNCYMMLRMEHARLRSGYRDPEEEDRLPWERDPDEWKRR